MRCIAYQFDTKKGEKYLRSVSFPIVYNLFFSGLPCGMAGMCASSTTPEATFQFIRRTTFGGVRKWGIEKDGASHHIRLRAVPEKLLVFRRCLFHLIFWLCGLCVRAVTKRGGWDVRGVLKCARICSVCVCVFCFLIIHLLCVPCVHIFCGEKGRNLRLGTYFAKAYSISNSLR